MALIEGNDIRVGQSFGEPQVTAIAKMMIQDKNNLIQAASSWKTNLLPDLWGQVNEDREPYRCWGSVAYSGVAPPRFTARATPNSCLNITLLTFASVTIEHICAVQNSAARHRATSG